MNDNNEGSTANLSSPSLEPSTNNNDEEIVHDGGGNTQPSQPSQEIVRDESTDAAIDDDDGIASIPATPQSTRSYRSIRSNRSSASKNSLARSLSSNSSRRRRALEMPSTTDTNISHNESINEEGGEEEDNEMTVPSTPMSKSSSKKRRSLYRKDEGIGNDSDEDFEESVPATPFENTSRTLNSLNNNSNSNSNSKNDGHDDHENQNDNVSINTRNTGYDSYGMYGGGSTVRSMTSFASRQSSRRTQHSGRQRIGQQTPPSYPPSDSDDNEEEKSQIQNDKNGNIHVNQITPLRQNHNRIQNNTANSFENQIQFEEESSQPTLNNNDDDNTNNLNQPTVLRGTDINVQTVQGAFKEFLQNFISLEDSEKLMRRQHRSKRNKARRDRRALKREEARTIRGAGGGGDGDDGDDDGNNSWDESLSSIDSYYSNDDNDDHSPKLYYMENLKDILLGRHHTNNSSNCNDENNNNDETMTSATAITTSASLDLNTIHLYYHSPQCQRLYHQLIMYPAEIVPLMDLIVQSEMEALLHQLHDEKTDRSNQNHRGPLLEEYDTLHPLNIPVPRVQVRPFNLKSLSHMRALDPQSIDSLLSIRGMIVRSTQVIPDLKVAHFECTICSASTTVTLERGRVSEPTVCQECNIKHGFDIIHNRSVFADKQMIRIQETPNEVPPGETPASIVLFAYDDLVDAVRPGDRVEVTGVFRAQGRRVNPKISKVKSVYKTYVDVIHFRRVSGNADRNQQVQQQVQQQDTSREDETNQNTNNTNLQGKGIAIENIGGKLSHQRIQELERLAKSPDIYERLVQSLAPSIWELDDVKKGILCMLFGGNSKRVKKGTAEKKRRLEQERARRSNMDSDDEMDMLSEQQENDEEEDTSKLNKRGDINILLCEYTTSLSNSISSLIGYLTIIHYCSFRR